ncbi:glycosyltransferase family 2 protein [Halorussus lipolyticus]|uniref:glycosyltransferase family 2 protein n=1 Tax=Halorussus lipolyticus TaxID=3034024 RepID=UPI0023E8EF54|nr:glycosyltransferase family 2 protein [Halorussus sp. DT80]
MYNGNTVGVVVPAYNEQGFVGEVIDTVPDFVDRVYVVDDCSTDDTWQEIRDHAERVNSTGPKTGDSEDSGRSRRIETEPKLADGGLASAERVVPIRHATNQGVGGAIKTGYRHAREDDVDVTAVMAGDGQMDPGLLARLIDPIVEHGADYAKGNRLLSPAFREDMPRFRLVGNWMLSFLTKISSGYWNTGDPQNGYTAISGRALDRIDIDSLYDDYGFANELLVRLNCHGMQVADVATPAVYGDEESTIEYHTFIPKVSWLLLSNFAYRLRTQLAEFEAWPTVAGYVLGAVGLVASLLVGVVAGLGAFGAVLVGSVVLLGVAMSLDRANNEGLEMQVTEGVEGA